MCEHFCAALYSHYCLLIHGFASDTHGVLTAGSTEEPVRLCVMDRIVYIEYCRSSGKSNSESILGHFSSSMLECFRYIFYHFGSSTDNTSMCPRTPFTNGKHKYDVATFHRSQGN